MNAIIGVNTWSETDAWCVSMVDLVLEDRSTRPFRAGRAPVFAPALRHGAARYRQGFASERCDFG